jgi:hypothetical protein
VVDKEIIYKMTEDKTTFAICEGGLEGIPF